VSFIGNYFRKIIVVFQRVVGQKKKYAKKLFNLFACYFLKYYFCIRFWKGAS